MKNLYIELANLAIEKIVNEGEILKLPKDISPEILNKKAPVFVTIYKNGNLRGCIGTLEAIKDNIGEEIIQNAISASMKDPRFTAITPDELEDLTVSVDVLMPAEKVESIEELDPKKYGVIVSKGMRRGVLLPNLEGVNDPETQVYIALQKAGLLGEKDFQLERFEVIRHE